MTRIVAMMTLMDSLNVFVWRVRFGLLALALGLVGVRGTKLPSSEPEGQLASRTSGTPLLRASVQSPSTAPALALPLMPSAGAIPSPAPAQPAAKETRAPLKMQSEVVRSAPANRPLLNNTRMRAGGNAIKPKGRSISRSAMHPVAARPAVRPRVASADTRLRKQAKYQAPTQRGSNRTA